VTQTVRNGFLRDDGVVGDGYPLVTAATAGTTRAFGLWRDDTLALATSSSTTVAYASAVAPLAVSEGFLRDANGAIVTVTSALASGTPSTHEGFLRDANYAVVTP